MSIIFSGTCTNNLKQLTLATMMYADGKNGVFPKDGEQDPHWLGGRISTASTWVLGAVPAIPIP